MCGIVGCNGKLDVKKYIINGLKNLDYRGYDSAGIGFLNSDIKVFKTVGTVDGLLNILPSSIDSNIAIGHTRWATHGKPNTINAHPHISFHNEFSLVHNGVIENFEELKEFLKERNYQFKSDTDTEILLNLIEWIYHEKNDVLSSLNELKAYVKGSFAIALMHKDDEKLYFYKKSSPLLIGLGKGFNLLASDASPMIEYTNDFIDLKDDEYGYINKDEVKVFFNGSLATYQVEHKSIELLKKDIKGYDHYMIKEIEEIKDVISRQIDAYYKDGDFIFDKNLISYIKSCDHIVFIGCGTSYHASLIGARYFERLGKTTNCFIASEWGYYPKFLGNKTLYVFLSQSGETADCIRCMKILKQKGETILTITNTENSTMMREANYSILLYAGIEVSVASTKAYSAMVCSLALLTRSINKKDTIVNELKDVEKAISKIYEQKEKIHEIAKLIKDSKDVFFLGRGYDYELSLEASLKLKEITYIHSEGIAGGELKHGPISLIDEGTPVIIFISDDKIAHAMRNNIKEVESRGAKTYIVSTEKTKHLKDDFIIDKTRTYLSVLSTSVFAFYLAYFVALEKGLNIDKPRNLAKAVTVE